MVNEYGTASGDGKPVITKPPPTAGVAPQQRWHCRDSAAAAAAAAAVASADYDDTALILCSSSSFGVEAASVSSGPKQA